MVVAAAPEGSAVAMVLFAAGTLRHDRCKTPSVLVIPAPLDSPPVAFNRVDDVTVSAAMRAPLGSTFEMALPWHSSLGRSDSGIGGLGRRTMIYDLLAGTGTRIKSPPLLKTPQRAAFAQLAAAFFAVAGV